KRYSGVYTTGEEESKKILGPVRHWLVWNEPNNPIFLRPQYRRVRGKWVVQSARDYAKMCAAVYSGVHATLLRGEKVGCGVTAPRGNNAPRTRRPSVSPILFLRNLKKAGLRKFDAYAHHPYAGRPSETPASRVRSRTNVSFGNLSVLIREVTRLYGKKRIWITEYGYETRPPDRYFGVSYARQARYLTQAFSLARRNPRIDMMLWFLLRDEPRFRGRDGWQSGLMTARGQRKPAFRAFQRLRR
ncbi:MAG: glycoside hydrolase family protein, partial [Actinomycetota bacterium]|nr:glycoside hydrolase family protein [Actinomycetota bacterium]